MNLKKALENNDLESFITEREKEKGDRKAFDFTLDSMVGKSKEVQEASSREKAESCSDTQTP